MLPAPPEAPPRAATSSSTKVAIAGAALLGGALVLGGVILLRAEGWSASDGHATARASRAVGLSAGAGFRGVVSIDLDAFRRGLLDGIASEPAPQAAMSRVERFARMRDVMRLLGEAEVAEVAERLDQDRDS
jgi:hypothetical protein